MAKKDKKMGGRNFALTIILGVFISIMVITLFNLIVSYAYEGPKYDSFCRGSMYPELVKSYPGVGTYQNCSFNKELMTLSDACTAEGNIPIYEYDNNGCAVSLKECNDCYKRYDASIKEYNRNTFFIFAFIGFALVVLGLSISVLLIQIITLPAGAFLVIEAAVKNFDNKLYVIITFALLIIAAVYLALKKLK